MEAFKLRERRVYTAAFGKIGGGETYDIPGFVISIVSQLDTVES